MIKTLTLMSIQHELGMATGQDLRLRPMLRHFMQACLQRLGLRGVYVYLATDGDGEPCLPPLGPHCHLRLFCALPEAQPQPPHQHAEIAQWLHGKTLASQPQRRFEQTPRHFCAFALGRFGAIVFERWQHPLEDNVADALAAVIKRLASTTLASIEHERSLLEIDKRQRAEDALREQLRLAHTSTRLAGLLAEEDDPQTILDQVVTIIGEAMGTDRTLIYDVDLRQDQGIGLAEWCNADAADTPPTIDTYPLDSFRHCVDAVAQKHHKWLESHHDAPHPLLVADDMVDMLHRQMNIRSLLWYPLHFYDGGFYLLVFNQTRYTRVWREAEIEFLGNIAQQISVALHKIRLLRQRERAEQDLRLAATAFETHEAIVITDQRGIIQRVNKAFTRITGYDSEEVVGKTPRILKSGRQTREFYRQMWEALNNEGYWQGEIWNKRKNGEVYPEWETITAVKNEHGEITHYVATFQDITERKQSEARIQHLAYFDSLTDLPNRALLLDRLKHELAVCQRHNVVGALLFLDIDRFKTINDALGHPTGDALLQQIARRLSQQVRSEDTVSRLGGDEFVVLLPQAGTTPEEANYTAQTVAEKIRHALAAPYTLHGHNYHLTPSIGIVLFPEEGDTIDDILKHADTAMYRAKAAGRNTIRFYLPSMQEAADQRLTLENDLNLAIEQNQFLLHYQPQVDDQGRLIGAEALLRWEHPRHGMIPPDQFIPVAEETGQILAIGEWVLHHATRQIKRWTDAGLCAPKRHLGLNVSPRQFHQNDFAERVIDIIERSGIAASCIKLEITESVVMNDVEDVINKMQNLQALGIQFAIDDFGTGYSSLAYLKRLPLNQLKIDKSFVQEILSDDNSAAIVETIISMSRHLRLDVIAEGVETEDELDFLRQLGCQAFQGYLFRRPLPEAEFTALLEACAAADMYLPCQASA